MADRPQLAIARPQVFVTDFHVALEFYRDRLGFEVRYTYGDPPFYGLVQRGGAALNLRHVDESVWRTDLDEPDLLAASISTGDLEALYREFQAAGVKFHQGLRTQEWGPDFIVCDPSGNLIAFSPA